MTTTRKRLSRDGLLRLALYETATLLVGPRIEGERAGIVTRVPPDLLEQAWRACEAAVEDGTTNAEIYRLVTGRLCSRAWAWWEWTQREPCLCGIEEALRLLELGELREQEIEQTIAAADRHLEGIGRQVWAAHGGLRQDVRLAEALIAATGRERLRPYRVIQ